MFCLKCILTNDITDPSTFLPHLLFPFTSPLIIYFYLLMNNVVSDWMGVAYVDRVPYFSLQWLFS
jgi:hypothetical protein